MLQYPVHDIFLWTMVYVVAVILFPWTGVYLECLQVGNHLPIRQFDYLRPYQYCSRFAE